MLQPVDNFVYNKRTTQASVDNFSVFSKSVFFFSTFIHNLFTPCSKRYPDLYPHAIALFLKEIFYLLTEFSTTYLRLFLHKYFYFFGTKEKRTLAYSPLVIQIPN